MEIFTSFPDQGESVWDKELFQDPAFNSVNYKIELAFSASPIGAMSHLWLPAGGQQKLAFVFHGNIMTVCFDLDNQFRMSILERLEQMERRMAEMTGSQQHKQGVGGGGNSSGNGGTQTQVRVLHHWVSLALYTLLLELNLGTGEGEISF